ncbi:DUF887-domain-containing protein [Mytilinidion resinicola]|uniref:DUF887-domain-containing protein n=1 Tax=Mytilinidion resinicola TaxID=574789 RepID=A0A6A6YW12_9PEZI|nr:DUF887-domain-containing protein [Mytilinidion resinicola]KAF2812748.1 DUF887-domain-containing protein [Mytilinidion resinicola]
MLDPFPIPAPPALANLVKPAADFFHFTTLPLHIHELILAFLFYTCVNVYFAPWISSHLFPRIYGGFNRRTRLNWNVHIVSLVQSSLINIFALWVMWVDKERAAMTWPEKIWGYTGASGMIQAFAGGYFLWDLCITSMHVHIFGWGMLAHAISALFVFSLGYRPFLNFYGSTFILYELSSPFLNVHWFCDKLNLTGSTVQLYNGMALLFTFFCSRLLWGSYQSVRVFYDIYRAFTSEMRDVPIDWAAEPSLNPDTDIMRFAGNRPMPLWLAVTYLGANIILNGLNWMWFGRMIETVRKRFDPPLGTKGTKKAAKEEVLVEGVDVDTDADAGVDGVPIHVSEKEEVKLAQAIDAAGRSTVEIEKSEVRSRRKA